MRDHTRWIQGRGSVTYAYRPTGASKITTTLSSSDPKICRIAVHTTPFPPGCAFHGLTCTVEYRAVELYTEKKHGIGSVSMGRPSRSSDRFRGGHGRGQQGSSRPRSWRSGGGYRGTFGSCTLQGCMVVAKNQRTRSWT